MSKPTLPTAQLSSSRRTSSAGPEQARLNSEIRALQNRVANLEGQIEALRKSTSWRVSAPLRWLSRRLRPVDGLADAVTLRRAETYEEWVRLYDTPAPGVADRLCSEMNARPRPPSISVILVPGAATAPMIAATCASIGAQAYARFDVVVAANADSLSAIDADCASAGVESTRRVRVPVDRNQPISRSLNAAVDAAKGDWLLLLKPGDVLAAHALCHLASEIEAHPEGRIIYADEDDVDSQGRRSNPRFKPDWNPELFYSRDFISSHVAISRLAALEAGGFREDFDPAPVYDLVLRMTEAWGGERVRHIPRVLCHRLRELSIVAPDASTGEAEKRALIDHFSRAGTAAEVVDADGGRCIRYGLPAEPPLVSLIIPTRNGLALVRQCIESIVAETTYPNYEILLVDNGSDDPNALAYFEELRRQPGITVIRDDSPFNYSALNNMAVRHARGEVIGLINNDIEVISPGWLDEMVSLALQPGVGAVGAKLLYPDETIQHGGVLLGVGGATSIAAHANKFLSAWDGGYMGRSLALQSFSAVTAACLVVRKALYEKVGGLNEVELKVAYNDVDFCLRLGEAGYRNLWTPHAKLFHHESATRGSDFSPEHRQRFDQEQAYMRSHWGALIARDPAYNPNLTVYAEDFGLAWPPRVPWLTGAAKP
ncbi:Glycosyltransferase, GT2 family [Variovorax sp. HW608]|uniref:glycosyltransferase family 2 protein n=1 Tax=Variovorax sp. HW608 TaxID=1034889 RepID=UPI00081F88FA|nr:glycosyltransferase family 2 protein [Variovorax sp. HW608]SCK37809.1 Glycosyltransferase, GT2 family [Variovorax sp. HW608]